MEKNKDLGPAQDLEVRHSSNNQQIVGINYVPLNEQEQAEVENLFNVN